VVATWLCESRPKKREVASPLHTPGPMRTSITIPSTAMALPRHTITREDVKYYMDRIFERQLDAMLSVVDKTQVRKRHSLFPVEYIIKPRFARIIR